MTILIDVSVQFSDSVPFISGVSNSFLARPHDHCVFPQRAAMPRLHAWPQTVWFLAISITVPIRLCSDFLTTSSGLPFLSLNGSILHLIVQFNSDMLCMRTCQCCGIAIIILCVIKTDFKQATELQLLFKRLRSGRMKWCKGVVSTLDHMFDTPALCYKVMSMWTLR